MLNRFERSRPGTNFKSQTTLVVGTRFAGRAYRSAMCRTTPLQEPIEKERKMLPRPVIVLARAVVLLIGGATALLVPSAPINAQEEIRPTGGRIVGGVPTYIEEHPWQVALLATRPDGTFFCGGSIISDHWILTAAHCLGTAGKLAKVQVKEGVTNYKSEGAWVRAARVEPHAAYNSATEENDIALVKVNSEQDKQAVIALASISTLLQVGTPLEITGWGATAEERCGGRDSSPNGRCELRRY